LDFKKNPAELVESNILSYNGTRVLREGFANVSTYYFTYNCERHGQYSLDYLYKRDGETGSFTYAKAVVSIRELNNSNSLKEYQMAAADNTSISCNIGDYFTIKLNSSQSDYSWFIRNLGEIYEKNIIEKDQIIYSPGNGIVTSKMRCINSGQMNITYNLRNDLNRNNTNGTAVATIIVNGTRLAQKNRIYHLDRFTESTIHCQVGEIFSIKMIDRYTNKFYWRVINNDEILHYNVITNSKHKEHTHENNAISEFSFRCLNDGAANLHFEFKDPHILPSELLPYIKVIVIVKPKTITYEMEANNVLIVSCRAGNAFDLKIPSNDNSWNLVNDNEIHDNDLVSISSHGKIKGNFYHIGFHCINAGNQVLRFKYKDHKLTFKHDSYAVVVVNVIEHITHLPRFKMK